MRTWLRRLRAVLGTGLVGTVLGGLLGGVIAAGGVVLAPLTFPLEVVLGLIGGMAAFGGFAAGTFAAFLSLAGGRRSLEEISTLHAGALGALAAALFAPVVAFLITGTPLPMASSELLRISSMFAVLGGGLGAGLVAIAKDANEKELEASPADRQALEAP